MQFSKLLSYLLHPILIPSIVLFISFNYVEHFRFVLSDYISYLFIIVSVFTIIGPLFSFLIFIKARKVESFEMRNKKERQGPLFTTSIIMLIGLIFFRNVSKLVPIVTSIYIASLIILILAYIITKKWKISLHMLGIGAATGTFISLNYIYGGLYYISLLLLLLSGLLGYARLNEKAHSKSQVYAGFLIGSIFQTTFILNYNSIISTISIFRSSIASIL